MLTNASPKNADSPAMIRSHASASEHPIPTAGPLTAATTRLGQPPDPRDRRVVDLVQLLADVGLAVVGGVEARSQVGTGGEAAAGAGHQYRANRFVGGLA